AEDDVLLHLLDVLLDELRIVLYLADLQMREVRADAFERGMHATRDGCGIRARLLLDRERHGIDAIQPRRRRSLLEAVNDRGDVPDPYGGPTVGAEDDLFDFAWIDELTLRAQRDRPAVARHPAAGEIEVLERELFGHHADRQTERFEAPGVDVDLHLAHVAAVDFHGGDAVDLPEERLEVVFD